MLVSLAIFFGIVLVLFPNDKTKTEKVVSSSDYSETLSTSVSSSDSPFTSSSSFETSSTSFSSLELPSTSSSFLEEEEEEIDIAALLASLSETEFLNTRTEDSAADNAESVTASKALSFQWKGVVLLAASINLGCVFDELQTLMLQNGPLLEGHGSAHGRSYSLSRSHSHNQLSLDRQAGGESESADVTVVLSWNMLSCVFFLTAGVIFGGRLGKVVEIVRTDKKTVFFTILLGIVNVLIQIAMISLKKTYGTWWKNIISACAKCLSIVSSVFFFGHRISPVQIVGIVLVIACILLAGRIQLRRKSEAKAPSNGASPC